MIVFKINRCIFALSITIKLKTMNTITNKIDFSNGMKSVEIALNKIEELVNNEDFRKAAAETCKQIGISAKEWNENKMYILMKFAKEIVLGK